MSIEFIGDQRQTYPIIETFYREDVNLSFINELLKYLQWYDDVYILTDNWYEAGF